MRYRGVAMAGNNWNEILSEMAEEAVCRAKEQDKKNWETYARGMAPPPPAASVDTRVFALTKEINFFGYSEAAQCGDVIEVAKRFEKYITTGE